MKNNILTRFYVPEFNTGIFNALGRLEYLRVLDDYSYEKYYELSLKLHSTRYTISMYNEWECTSWFTYSGLKNHVKLINYILYNLSYTDVIIIEKTIDEIGRENIIFSDINQVVVKYSYKYRKGYLIKK